MSAFNHQEVDEPMKCTVRYKDSNETHWYWIIDLEVGGVGLQPHLAQLESGGGGLQPHLAQLESGGGGGGRATASPGPVVHWLISAPQSAASRQTRGVLAC